MQQPTCTNLKVRTPRDALVIFYAVYKDILPMVNRRLDTEERRAISSGCVFVWEERGPNAEATGLGIERWTDGIRWGPSRVKEEFLFYQEKDPDPVNVDMNYHVDRIGAPRARPHSSRGILRDDLVKQTYSVFVETPLGKRKWHLIAYFTQDSVDYLKTIDDVPALAKLTVPPGMFKSARSAKRHTNDVDPKLLAALHHSRYQCPSSDPPYCSCRPEKTDPQANPDVGHVIIENDGHFGLAPLAYLQNLPPPRRHPLDEKALMSFIPALH